jgi:hypothetical protein
MNPSQKLKDYWEANDELCEDYNIGAGNKKNCERRPHVIEDAPSRIAPNLLKKLQEEEILNSKVSRIKFQ